MPLSACPIRNAATRRARQRLAERFGARVGAQVGAQTRLWTGLQAGLQRLLRRVLKLGPVAQSTHSARTAHSAQAAWPSRPPRLARGQAVQRGLLLAAALAATAVQADRDRDHDHDRARDAVQAGQVLPLKTVLERLARDHPGQVLEVALEREDGRWVYEVKLLQTGGRLLKLELDARSGALLKRRERDPASAASAPAAAPASAPAPAARAQERERPGRP